MHGNVKCTGDFRCTIERLGLRPLGRLQRTSTSTRIRSKWPIRRGDLGLFQHGAPVSEGKFGVIVYYGYTLN